MLKSFLQSEHWVVFKRSVGKSLFQAAGSWWEKRSVPLVGTYWYGPRVQIDDVQQLLAEAKEAGVVFLRVDATDQETYDQLVASGVVLHQVKEEQPATSLLLDLTKTEDELRKAMKAKTRYNIGVAQKHGLETEVIEGVLPEAVFADVWSLMDQTTSRHGIRNYSREYYEGLNQAGFGIWVLTAKDDQLLSAHYCVGQNGRLVYLYGASSTKSKQLMSAYLTQWTTIVWAKEHGFSEYDFWGIAPRNADALAESQSMKDFNASHQLSGVTRFKIGFGGEVISYPSTVEIPLRPLRYQWYRLLKQIRCLIKR